MNYTTFTATTRAMHAMMAQDCQQRQHARHLITNLFIAKPLHSANAGGGR